MKKKEKKNMQTPVVCTKCHKTIEPNEDGLVTKYIWKNGINICLECGNVKSSEVYGKLDMKRK